MSITHSRPARRARSERLHGTCMPLKGGLPMQLSLSGSARGRCGDIEPLGNRGAGDDRRAI
jgi:hypothetical protein